MTKIKNSNKFINLILHKNLLYYILIDTIKRVAIIIK